VAGFLLGAERPFTAIFLEDLGVLRQGTCLGSYTF
jgi:hypothetical protein